MLVAGFFVHDILPALSWLKYLSFVFYGYSLLQKVSLLLMTISNWEASQNIQK